MKCQVYANYPIREWSMQRFFNGASNTDVIFANWKGRKNITNPHFGIANDMDGSVVLYKNSTELNDAGIYTCTVRRAGGQLDRYSAQLIVFGQ